MTVVALPHRARALAVLAAVALALTACAPADEESSTSTDTTDTTAAGDTPSTLSTDECATDKLNLIDPGTLTIATDSPAYEPWFKDNDPANGKGYEGAVAYAVAGELGFGDDQVSWVEVPFNKSYAPGEKDFDFDINQISITPARAEVVDFSVGYYRAAQAVIVLNDSEFADASSLADLKDARIGAQVGTTSLSAAQDVIAPTQDVLVYDDTNAAKQALANDQLDAIVTDLPTAFYITAAEIEDSTIVGQFQPTSGETEEFGLLFEKGNPLVGCVNQAIARLEKSGTLADLEQRWLSNVADVPELS